MNEAGTPHPNCENCGAPVTGRFCSVCGQRIDENVHSVWEFVREAFEVVTEADSRLWQTLWRLLLKPGLLTREFFAGRRVRYLPAVRLYFVLSLAFFVLSSLRGGADPSFVFDDGDPQQALADLQDELGAIQDPDRRERVQEQIARLRDQLARASEAPGESAGDAGASPAAANDKTPEQVCEDVHLPFFGLDFDNTLRAQCETMASDNGSTFLKSFLDNLPSAMFLFLPLLAAFMKLLYIFNGRYYVQHLLLLIHNHAAAFFILLLYEILALVTPAGWHGLFIAFIVFYLPWYTYRSLRVMYGQGRAFTLLKFFALFFSYLVVGTLMVAVTAVYSALTL